MRFGLNLNSNKKSNIVRFPKAFEHPLYYKKNGELTPIPERKAIVGENGVVYSIVSDKYRLVQHEDVYKTVNQILEELGIDPLLTDVKISRNGGAMLYTVLTDDCKLLNNDYVYLGFSAYNTYDGSSSLRFDFFGFRVVCSNGLIMPRKILDLPKFRHLKGVIDPTYEEIAKTIKGLLDLRFEVLDVLNMATKSTVSAFDLVSFIETTFKNYPLLKENIYRTLKKHGIDLTEALKEYEEFVKQEKELEKLLEKLEKEEYNLWTAYNSITEVLTHRPGKVDLPNLYKLQRKTGELLALAR